MSGPVFNWTKFFQEQGRASAQLEQVRLDVKRIEDKLDAVARAQVETKVLVGAVRGGYKTIATTALVVGAIATLIARWWVITH